MTCVCGMLHMLHPGEDMVTKLTGAGKLYSSAQTYTNTLTWVKQGLGLLIIVCYILLHKLSAYAALQFCIGSC